MVFATISWAAVLAGFAGTWIAGKHRHGWLIGLICCTLWAAYDIRYAIWAGLFASVIGAAINTRNWHLGRTPPANDQEPT